MRLYCHNTCRYSHNTCQKSLSPWQQSLGITSTLIHQTTGHLTISYCQVSPWQPTLRHTKNSIMGMWEEDYCWRCLLYLPLEWGLWEERLAMIALLLGRCGMCCMFCVVVRCWGVEWYVNGVTVDYTLTVCLNGRSELWILVFKNR